MDNLYAKPSVVAIEELQSMIRPSGEISRMGPSRPYRTRCGRYAPYWDGQEEAY